MVEEQSKLWIKFEYRAVEDRQASLKKNRAIYKAVEYYKITLPGGNEVREGPVTDLIKANYMSQYEGWKKLQETPEKGTDLKNWTLMPIHLIYEARAIGIKTVEELVEANLSEKETPNLCFYQNKAVDWLYQNDSAKSLKKKVKQLKQKVKMMTNQFMVSYFALLRGSK